MRQLKLILVVALLVIIGIVIAQNLEPVETKLIVTSVQVRLSTLLIGTLGVGYLLGLLTTAWWRVRQWRHEALAARRQADKNAAEEKLAEEKRVEVKLAERP